MRSFIVLFLSFLLTTGYSQTKSIKAKYIDTDILIDGNLNESEWNLANESGNFYQFFPRDSVPASQPSNF